MKLALICFSVLTSISLWFGAQGAAPVTCRGKPLPISLLPGPKMTGPELPLRFGGTRSFPRPPINNFRSEKPFRLVIKNRDEFGNFWKQLPGPLPEVDFSKEMVVVAGFAQKVSIALFSVQPLCPLCLCG